MHDDRGIFRLPTSFFRRLARLALPKRFRSRFGTLLRLASSNWKAIARGRHRALGRRGTLSSRLCQPYTAGSQLLALSGSRSEPLSFRRDPLADYRSELLASLAGFRRRLWLYRSALLVLRGAVLAALAVLLLAVLDLFGVAHLNTWAAPVALATLAGGAFLAGAQRLSYFEVARVVDRQLGLKAQLGTAVQLTLAGSVTLLGHAQVRQATTIARRIEPRQAIGSGFPGRDIRLLVSASALAAVISFASAAGLRAPLPDATAAASLSSIENHQLNSWFEVDPTTVSTGSDPRQSPSDPRTRIDRLKEQLARSEITPLEYASKVAGIEEEARRQADLDNRQTTALGDLARALGDASSTRAVAESLTRGDYSQAAQDLASTSSHADSMSPEARKELADRLAQAARDMAGNSPSLSGAVDRAARALSSGDSAASREALADLASAVGQRPGAADQTQTSADESAPPSDLAEAGIAPASAKQQPDAADLSPVGGDRPPSDNPTGDPTRLGQPSGPADLSPAGTRAAPSSSDLGANAGDNPNGDLGASTILRSGSSGAGEAAGQGGGAGSGRGERIVTDGASTARRAEATGNVLRISGKASSAGQTVRSASPANAPLTSAGASTASVESSGGPRSGVVVNTTSESNLVPLEMKPIVKDYFTVGDRP